MENQVLVSVVVALVTGGISSLGTVMALKVHILYLRESTIRAHRRIDSMESKVFNSNHTNPS